MNAKEVLTEAARLLRDVGWTQTAWARDQDGVPTTYCAEDISCLCMLGALERSVMNASTYSGYVQATRKLDRLLGGLNYGGAEGLVAKFNDTPGRTKEECIAKLLEAAEL